MPRSRRMELMQQISSIRQSVVISYITGDRENVSTRIAPDVVQVIYRHLEKIRPGSAIDLFIYTRGGDVLTPWRLVNLFREYTDYFCVLVPFRAYSAGTLLALGADEIVMGKMGELGPIDPSVINAFNPQDVANPLARLPVSIEDVYSYMALMSQKMGLHSEQALMQAFLLLAKKIHPLALGNVHRNWMLIRSLAHKMLCLRRDKFSEEKSRHIIDHLTEKLYAHHHMITRKEAADVIGLPVVDADNQLNALMWALYEDIATELRLAEPFNPQDILKGHRSKFEISGGIVESMAATDYFVFSGVAERGHASESCENKINVNIHKQGWYMTQI